MDERQNNSSDSVDSTQKNEGIVIPSDGKYTVVEQKSLVDASKSLSSGISPEWREAVSHLTSAMGPVSNAAESFKSTQDALVDLSKRMSSLTKQVDTKGIADALSAVGIATRSASMNNSYEKSEGMKEFDERFGLLEINTIQDAYHCAMRIDDLTDIVKRIQHKGQYSSSKMLLTEEHLDMLKERLQQLNDSIENFKKAHSTYDISRTESNIDSIIQEAGMTRIEVEKALLLGKGFLGRAFNPDDGKRRLSVDNLCLICSCFNQDAGRVLTTDLQKEKHIGESKTVEFMEKIIDATGIRKLKWEPYSSDNRTSEHADAELRSLSIIENVVPEIWMTQTLKGMMYFISMVESNSGTNSVTYKIGADKRGHFRWLFDTLENKNKSLDISCGRLHEMIKAFQSAGFVSAEAEELMDEILSGLEEPELPFA